MKAYASRLVMRYEYGIMKSQFLSTIIERSGHVLLYISCVRSLIWFNLSIIYCLINVFLFLSSPQ